ncbi:hypothetical protein Mefer_0965 [Methanocaldococcus fervens AG86]|uniref:Uncharacterized protein n=1 Tax=Methanocaldococcus fervens (strain DSM 4213 / JCM 15782 / AG86) TaxID=573064 RepID=C7P8A1_METFA|nr:hypothetical protein Mefer_0965 [Methanocaldococcus fervens AG86]
MLKDVTYLLLYHRFTERQIRDARKFERENFIYLLKDLQRDNG